MAPLGNKSQRDRWNTLGESIAQMCLMHIHTMHIPFMLLYSWSPFSADLLLQKHASSTPADLLYRFFTSLRGEVEKPWQHYKHYIANSFPLIKVWFGCSFYLLSYIHSSIKLGCKLGSLADWHFWLGEKYQFINKMKCFFYINPLWCSFSKGSKSVPTNLRMWIMYFKESGHPSRPVFA